MNVKRKVKIIVELEVPFYSYGSKRKDNKAKSDIKKWVKEAIEDDCVFIPLYVEEDENGSAIEGATQKSKIKITKCEMEK